MGQLVYLFVVGFIIAGVAVPTEKPVRFDGHHLIRVKPTSDGHAAILKGLQDDATLNLDFWTPVGKNRAVDIHVSQENIEEILSICEEVGIDVEILHEDIQKLIDEERKSMSVPSKRQWTWGNQVTSSLHRQTYLTHSQVNAWISLMAQQHRDIASVRSIGRTYEGRDMRVITITDNPNKPAILIDAGIHAREWLAPATALYIIEQILNDYKSQSYLRKYTWYILPVVNPDGYDYSHRINRLWRKTRSQPTLRGCYGADPNRNFDSHFGEAGVSSNPCADTYPGPKAFSEKCTTNLKNFILGAQKQNQIKLYLSFHTYHQLWLTPWGYTDRLASDHREMMRVANIGADAIKSTSGEIWEVGPPARILYAASGGSFDWAKAVAGVKYAYVLELRPGRGHGLQGFIQSATQILPSGKEIYAAVKAVAKKM